MNAGVILGIAIIGAVLWSYGKTAVAGLSLDYQLSKFQLYKFASDGIKFRFQFKFVNSKPTPLHIQMINVKCYIDSVYTARPDGSLNITNTGKLIGTCQDATAVTIPANNITENYFYATISYFNLLTSVGTKVLEYIQNNDPLKPKNVLITGFIKAEGINIPITQVIPFN